MDKKYYLGIDVGGTKIEGAIAELNISTSKVNVFAKKRISNSSQENPDEFIRLLSVLIDELINESGHKKSDLLAIGIGLPGSLDPKTKIMMNGNTRFLIGFDVMSALKKKLQFDVPIFLENDANLFILAEAWGGAGLLFRKEKSISFKDQVAVGITLGTGVGGGLFSSGQVYTGAHGASLEVGHIFLDPHGPACYCGQRGCAETYLSGTALNKNLSSKEIFSRAKEKDGEALSILKEYRQNLVRFLSILNNLFDPHYFVFGGGLSSQEMLFIDLRADLENNIFLSKEYCPLIYINQLGDSAGLFGAMIYAENLLHS